MKGFDWDSAWSTFDSILEDLGYESQGEPWAAWALATFIDVPSFAIAGMVPEVRAKGQAKGFDLVARVRDGVSAAVKRLPPEEHGPLPLEFGLTEALLAWDWADMEEAGDPPWTFFERLRELRLRIPEVTLCERTVHRFCCRVPPPRID
ncbi:MAG: hypothetical protein ABFS86_15610 [Planctomycetota bacterium]